MARMSRVNFSECFGQSEEDIGEDGKTEYLRQLELVFNEFCFLKCLYGRVWNKMTRSAKLLALDVAWLALEGYFEKFKSEYELDKLNLQFDPREYCNTYNLDQFPNGPFHFENLQKGWFFWEEEKEEEKEEEETKKSKRKRKGKNAPRKKRLRAFNVNQWKRRVPVSDWALPEIDIEEENAGERNASTGEIVEREGPIFNQGPLSFGPASVGEF
jgi:hypothetical protein